VLTGAAYREWEKWKSVNRCNLSRSICLIYEVLDNFAMEQSTRVYIGEIFDFANIFDRIREVMRGNRGSQTRFSAILVSILQSILRRFCLPHENAASNNNNNS
jgi:hypothetical protein